MNRSTQRRSGRAGDQGAALVLVVWMLGMLALLAAVASRLALVQNSQSTLVRTGVHEDLALAAGLDLAAARILKDSSRPRGTDSIELGRQSVSISYENETARIDINNASEPLLAGLFQSVGVRAGEAERLAAAVADWRDSDDETRPRGAERLAYGRDRPAPRNGPFLDPREIGRVLGVPPAVAAAVQPAITVASGTDRIDSAIASRAVMLALPGMTPLRLAAYEAALRRGTPDQAMAILGDVGAYLGAPSARTWRVAIDVSGAGGGVTRYSAILLAPAGPDRPYDVLVLEPAADAVRPPAAPQATGKR